MDEMQFEKTMDKAEEIKQIARIAAALEEIAKAMMLIEKQLAAIADCIQIGKGGKKFLNVTDGYE